MRVALCKRSLVGYALSLPLVCGIGAVMFAILIGDVPPGVSRPRWERPALAVCAGLAVAIQVCVPILALRSLKKGRSRPAPFRVLLVGVAAGIGWVCGLRACVGLAAAIPPELSFLGFAILVAGPVCCAVAGVYIGSLLIPTALAQPPSAENEAEHTAGR
jgi:hypothetical protein